MKAVKHPKPAQTPGQYELVETFRKAMLQEAIAATKHLDWAPVLATAKSA